MKYMQTCHYNIVPSWEVANEYCEQLGGHLVTITEENENAAIGGRLGINSYYIAMVDEDGAVFGISQGAAVITATTVDGGFSASCEVTVTEATPVIIDDPAPEGITVNIGTEKVKLESTHEISGVVMVGVYNEAGKLLRIEVKDAQSEITTEGSNPGEYAKVFWWEDINGLIPVCEAVSSG